MSTSPSGAFTHLRRAAWALLGLTSGVFFGGVGCLVLVRSFNSSGASSPWVSVAMWFLRGFLALIFGSIAGGGFAHASSVVRGARVAPLPAALRARCPACGEPYASDPGAGAGCRHPSACSAAWSETAREELGGTLLGLTMAGAILLLGLGIASFVIGEGHGRVILTIVNAATALLFVGVGGPAAWSSGVELRNGLRKRGVRDFTLQVIVPTRSVVSAHGHLAGGVLTMAGTATRWMTIDEAPAVDGAPPPQDTSIRALIRALAVLHARGKASLIYEERVSWTFGTELTSSTAIDVLVEISPAPVDVPADESDVFFTAASGRSVKNLGGSMGTCAELRGAIEALTERLPASEVEPHTRAVLAAVLRGPVGGAAAAYREPG